jgi:hypothetical protein
LFSVPCLLFSFFVFVFVFLQGRGSVCPGGYAGLSQGWLGEYCMMLGAHLLICQMSPKEFWSQHLVLLQPSCFLSVTWCGKVFHGLGVQTVKVLILLGALFPPGVAPASQQGFGVMELMLSASVP